MLRPSVFEMNKFFDDFDSFWGFEPAPFFGDRRPRKALGKCGSGRELTDPERNPFRSIRTDVKEVDGGHEIDMELPGFTKEEVTAELKDGFLTVKAEHNSEENEEKKDFVRREIYRGSYMRSFNVGEDITEEDITAKFENGLLTLTIPKKEKKQEEETSKFITIQ